MNRNRRFVSYLRVSTDKQGRSGLGLEGQRQAVLDFLNGGSWEHVAEYVETESGSKKDRPQLQRALAACRVHGATLVVAKLDRLTRNVAFLSALRDSGVEFVCADNPHANRLTIDILVAVAEDELRRISDRTKAALAAAKARGVKLGSPDPRKLTAEERAKGTEASAEARRARANSWAEDVLPYIEELREAGAQSLRELARGLTERGVPTASGRGSWTAAGVQRVLKRLE